VWEPVVVGRGSQPIPRRTSHWSGRPTQQAFCGFFGIIAGGPPLTGGVRAKIIEDVQPEKGSVMRYKVVLQKSEEGYSVSCPGLPGCWSQGATEAEALENIQDAIREYLAAIEDILHDTPEAEVREVEVVV
jgi:predicted RNase H-like HicB family nuclease